MRNHASSAPTALSTSQQSALDVVSPSINHGAVNASRSAASSTHGKLHKRGNSGSSVGMSFSPPAAYGFDGAAEYGFKRSDTNTTAYDQNYEELAKLTPSSSTSNPLKLKPYLKKLSVKDNHGIDLSRPAAENESLAGLGINGYGGSSRAASEVNFSPVGARLKHSRSTSNQSSYSTSSGLPGAGAPYMHPMRQTPRPYTPPMSTSVSESMPTDEEMIAEYGQVLDEETLRTIEHWWGPTPRTGDPPPMSQRPRLFIPRIDPLTGLPKDPTPTQSETSIQFSVSGSRPRTDTLKSNETPVSPSSRTSLDKAFSFIRGSRDSPPDPASRAASIHAARIAYREKEEAKERKAQLEYQKQMEREALKVQKQRLRERRKSDEQEDRELRRRVSAREPIPPSFGSLQMPVVPGLEYESQKPAHERALPKKAPKLTPPPKSPRLADKQSSQSMSVRNRWLFFVSWLRTRILRMRRKLQME